MTKGRDWLIVIIEIIGDPVRVIGESEKNQGLIDYGMFHNFYFLIDLSGPSISH